ncbi:TBC1 domain family member 28 [Frankliniella fusca]|uniref:TBC1 domain family member 28 n=1 Tax=Frankliniella fusca TaxID=407009 RepID=A0AAE1HLQ2_9NEOP|nr:TBC1 domain family member 28 [Frankliniella fusca]
MWTNYEEAKGMIESIIEGLAVEDTTLGSRTRFRVLNRVFKTFRIVSPSAAPHASPAFKSPGRHQAPRERRRGDLNAQAETTCCWRRRHGGDWPSETPKQDEEDVLSTRGRSDRIILLTKLLRNLNGGYAKVQHDETHKSSAVLTMDDGDGIPKQQNQGGGKQEHLCGCCVAFPEYNISADDYGIYPGECFHPAK